MSPRDIDVYIAPYAADVFIVWVNTSGRHTPMASCGSAGHAEIVQAALALMARQVPEMLEAAINALPRTAVPCAHEPLPEPPAKEQA